jgi:hypothetical protein
LLGTSALKAFIAGDAALHTWLDQQEAPLSVSVVSVASLLASAEALKDVARRREWIERLTSDVPADFGPRLRVFDLMAAKQWSAVRVELGATVQVPEGELYVVATGLAEELDYVERRLDWHKHIRSLRQHDPWTATSYPI